MAINNLPVPGDNRAVTAGDVAKSAGKAVARVLFPHHAHKFGWHKPDQEPPRAVQKREAERGGVQPYIDDTEWTVENISRYIYEHGGLPPNFKGVQPTTSEPTTGEHTHGDKHVTYNITINNAPPPATAENAEVAKAKKKKKSKKRKALEIAGYGALGAGKFGWFLLQKLFSDGEKERKRQHEVQLALIAAQNKPHGLSEGATVFLLVASIALIIAVCGAFAHPWHYFYDYPVIIHHDYGRYEQIR